MAGRPKLLVLALDAASAPLLEQWAADGTLPHLAGFLRGATVGHTRNLDGLFVGSTWPSFSTGLNPAGHGIYWLDILRQGSYEIVRMGTSQLSRRQNLWEVLSDAGRRVLVLDVPLSRLSPRLNGIQTLEWGCHDPAFGFRTRPGSLRRRILDLVGPHPAPVVCDRPQRSSQEYQEFARQLSTGARLRGTLTRELLRDEPWDFAIQVFSETHCAGHQLWHYHDPSHPGYDAELTAREGNLLREVYRAADGAVGAILQAVEPDTTVAIVALHGMTRMYGCHYLTADILLRLGLMVRASGGAPETARPPEGFAGRLRSLYHHLPENIRRPVYGARHAIRRRWMGRGEPMDLDPLRSRCFDVGLGPNVSAIRFNLRGREPQGIVAPGEEAGELAAELTREFFALVNPETGQPLVARVFRTAELFQGPFLSELPDLLVEWSETPAVGSRVLGSGGGAILRATSPRVGLLEYHNTYGRSGDHQIGGIFAARGPGLETGRIPRISSILDLAPTFARMLGCEMPGVDGEVIPELLGG